MKKIDYQNKSHEVKWAEAERQLDLNGIHHTKFNVEKELHLPFTKSNTDIFRTPKNQIPVIKNH